jgi:hypothetical protein
MRISNGRLTIPFVGLAEGMVLAAFRETGLPLQRIRPALERLEPEMGLEHALASEHLGLPRVQLTMVVTDHAASASSLA